MNYTLPMMKYTIILKDKIIFFHKYRGRSNIYTRRFGNISPRIWNALQTKQLMLMYLWLGSKVCLNCISWNTT